MKKRQNEPILGIPRGWFYIILGIFLAPILSFTFLLKYIGWFFGALVHEMGHCAVAYFFGCIAFPAIRLDGHAAAFHRDQSTMLAFLVWALLGFATFYFFCQKKISFVCLFGALTLSYPMLAFTNAKEFKIGRAHV